MKLFKKTISALCVLAMLVALFCSCGKERKMIAVGDKTYSADTTVLTVDGEEISLEFYRYCFLTVKEALLKQDPKLDFSKKENADNLSSEVMGQVRYILGVEKLAKKYEYTLTEEDYADIDDTMESVFDRAGGATAYKELLGENYMDHEIYKRMLSVNILESKMAETLCGTDKDKNGVLIDTNKALQYFYDNYYRMLTMMFEVETADNNNEPLSTEDFNKNKEETKKVAEAAYAEIKGGKSFEEVMKKYNGEEDYEADLQSYYSISDIEYTSQNVDYDLKSMKEGDNTEVLYFTNCYYIIKRLELDKEYIKENVDYDAVYAEKVFADTLEQTSESLKIEESELYKQITVDLLA